ncbi:MAG: flagellar basal body L-ring protein FlgH [Myxococcota bacterium]
MKLPGLALALLVLGCAHSTADEQAKESTASALPAPPVPKTEDQAVAEGSLWRGDDSRRFLAFENRATRVGDLITVLIQEQAVAENEASTELERDSTYEATLDSEISLQAIVSRPILNLLNLLGFTDQRSDDNPTTELEIVEAQTRSEYTGEGTVKREASFETKVACMVTEVTESGLLRIEGERRLTINRETQVIRLSGYVRPEDVQIDNTIPSTLIASADIYYGGYGVVSEHQRPPWLMRVFQLILPF